MRNALLPLLLAPLLVGCPDRSAPPEPVAEEAEEVAAVPEEPTPAPFVGVALVDGEELARIQPDDPAVTVPPGAALELRSDHAFRQLRVRLLDERGRLVPSHDEIAIGQGTRVRIEPQQPLSEGARYRLVVDEPGGQHLEDVGGTPFTPTSLWFTVAGPNGAE